MSPPPIEHAAGNTAGLSDWRARPLSSLNAPDSPLTLAAVETYRQGRTPLPLVPGAKRPALDHWQQLVYRDESAVVREFGAMIVGAGLGVVLGDGLADVDLDTATARRAARHLLPDTPMRSGRESAPASHWWYHLADGAEHYVKHTGPDGSAVVEVRADARHQTAIPPTVHPSGEPYRWEGRPWDTAELPAADVLAGAASVALVAVLADAWPGEGSRHDACLSFVGGLLRGCEGVPGMVTAAERIVSALATLTGDHDGARARVAEAVPTTVRRLRAGENVTGWTRLGELLPGEDAAAVVRAAQSAADHLRAALGVRVEYDTEGGPLYVDLSALVTTGRLPEPPRPDYLRRADGAPLLYRGRVNRLFGDPESGKTWVLLAAAATLLSDHGRVAHVDVDHMGAALLVGRLGLLAVPPAVLGDPARFRLYEPADAEALRSVCADVAAWSPDLVGVDSLGEVLPMLGLSSNSPDDYTEAHRAVIQPLADCGACVVVIDHLAKGADSRRQGPGGTLAKGRPVRGVSLRVRRLREYAPGKGGASALSVDKDTPGGVRAACPASRGGGEQPAGVFRLCAVGEGGLSWAIDPPTPDGAEVPEVIDVVALERLSRALENSGEPLSQSKAAASVGVHRSRVGDLLDLLAAGGYVRRFHTTRNGGRANVSESVKPYREGYPLPGEVAS